MCDQLQMSDYRAAFATIGQHLNDNQLQVFMDYSDLLRRWNQVMNLTTIEDAQGILWRHFIDSCQLLEHIEVSKSQRVIDIGSGAGFPGLPIAIITGANTTLLDALNKRIQFIDTVVNKTLLKTVLPVHGRAEDLARDPLHRAQYDIALSRAVTQLPILLEYAIPFLKIGGCLVAHKSVNNIEVELGSTSKALQLLKTEHTDKIEYKDINGRSRMYLVFKKMAETNIKYPRRAGIPSKRSL